MGDRAYRGLHVAWKDFLGLIEIGLQEVGLGLKSRRELLGIAYLLPSGLNVVEARRVQLNAHLLMRLFEETRLQRILGTLLVL